MYGTILGCIQAHTHTPSFAGSVHVANFSTDFMLVSQKPIINMFDIYLLIQSADRNHRLLPVAYFKLAKWVLAFRNYLSEIKTKLEVNTACFKSRQICIVVQGFSNVGQTRPLYRHG